METRHAALVAATVLTLTGCGTDRTQRDLSPGVDPGGATGSVLVYTDLRAGPHGEMFTEGAVSEIRLVGADGQVHGPEHDHAVTATFSGLSPGVYGLRGVLRPCDGNCGTLDAPILPCTGKVRVDGREVLHVVWRLEQGCRVTRG